MGLRSVVVEPGRFFDDVPDEPDPRTVWSVIGSPMIDPDGWSDAALKLTMRRSVARVWTRRAVVGELIDDAIDEVERRRERDAAIMRAVGADARRTQPWVGLRPEAVAQLRVLLLEGAMMSGAGMLQTANRTGEDGPVLRTVEALGNALLLSDAVPFFVPSTIAAALMTSDPPDKTLEASIRLPFESVFMFFDAIALGDLEFDGSLGGVDGATIDPSTASLLGVVLHAGEEGVGLDPVVRWVVTYPIGDTHGVVQLAGVWRASAQPGVVGNLAALCTWGDWASPPPDPPQLEGAEGSRTWRRSLGRSAVRKALARGAVVGVHLVDVAALARSSGGTAPTSTGRSVRTHWRRGYWNSVRVATRDADGNIVGDRLGEQGVDWHYEGRWIHPLVVHGTASEVITVYAIPEPSRDVEDPDAGDGS